MTKNQKILQRIYTSGWFKFWLLIPVVLLIYPMSDFTIDIQLHDTYFVVAGTHLLVILILFLLLSGAGYLANPKMETHQALCNLHVWTTLAALLLLVFHSIQLSLKSIFFISSPFVLLLATLLILIGIIAYFINIFWSLRR